MVGGGSGCWGHAGGVDQLMRVGSHAVLCPALPQVRPSCSSKVEKGMQIA